MQSLIVCLWAQPRALSRIATRQLTTPAAAAEHLPRIAQPSLWSSVIPRFLRRRQHPHEASANAATSSSNAPPSRFRAWLQNPSTSLIILAMLTGSQAIQVMVLNQDIEERRYTARRRMNQLKNVLRRIQDGEQIDLAAELGTGDPQAEAEWKEMIDQIADEDFWVLPKLPARHADGSLKKSEPERWRALATEKNERRAAKRDAKAAEAESKDADAVAQDGEKVRFSSWSFWANKQEKEPVMVEEQAIVATAEPSRRAFY